MNRTYPLLAAAAVLPLLVGATLTAAKRPTGAPVGLCVASDLIVSRHAAGPQEIVLRLAGGRQVRSRLDQPCAHLAELDRGYLLVFDHPEGSRLCGGDRFRLVDPVVARGGDAAGFAWCRFGAFERVPDGAR